MKLSPKIYVSVIAVGICLAILIWVHKIYDQYASVSVSSSEGTVLNQDLRIAPAPNISTISDKGTIGLPKIGGSFQLVDHHGIPRTEADFKGKYMMVYFGYSFCPDICPMALSSMSQALTDLGPKAQQITPIFITIDPERDTFVHLDRYISNYHPNFVALTGSPEQINQAKKAYRVFGDKAKPDGTSADYLMDHSSIVYIMDRQGRFVSHFSHVTPSHEMHRIMNELIN